jgi:hypothetical protein
VLALATLGAPAIFGELVSLVEFGDFLFEIHGRDYSGCRRSARVSDLTPCLQRKSRQ